MSVNIDITCEFCGKKSKFSECKQVPLKVDKDNVFQFLFAWICETCSSENSKKTINGQSIKVVNSRSKEEQTVFDIK